MHFLFPPRTWVRTTNISGAPNMLNQGCLFALTLVSTSAIKSSQYWEIQLLRSTPFIDAAARRGTVSATLALLRRAVLHDACAVAQLWFLSATLNTSNNGDLASPFGNWPVSGPSSARSFLLPPRPNCIQRWACSENRGRIMSAPILDRRYRSRNSDRAIA